MDAHTQSVKRIAVLGGGTGALFAALALTSLPDAATKYKITVYQMGWRLGGKGASGRRAEQAFRIEEHGLHVWSGFYENAIGWFRTCLEDLAGEPHVYTSFEEAFFKYNQIALPEDIDGTLVPWLIDPPDNDETPGTGGVVLHPMEYLRMLYDFIFDQKNHPDLNAITWRAPQAHGGQQPPKFARRLDRDVFHNIQTLTQQLPRKAQNHDPDHLTELHALTQDAHGQIRTEQERLQTQRAVSHDARRALMILDLATAAARGIVMDGLLFHGFDVIDNIEATDWLLKHGASPDSVDGALMRAVYSYAFGFSSGIGEIPDRSISAGVFLKGVLRLVFTYKGSFFYKMNAGMGDTIFAPLYKLLKKRGVAFKFFHKVENLGLDARGKFVETLRITRQAQTVDGHDYQPFVRVKGLDCWPSEPDWSQLAGGQAQKNAGVHFESAWSRRTGFCELPLLRRGHDFDEVILGISLGALPYVAPELIRHSTSWRTMVEKVKTTRTQAFQLWFNETVEDLGWPHGSRILTAFNPQTDTWADMSNLSEVEDWPDARKPKSIAYFCGVMRNPDTPPDFSDQGYPDTMRQLAKNNALDWLKRSAPFIFPNALDGKGDFAFDTLTDVDGNTGDDLWDAQYFRSNIDPTEEYVLSVPGSTGARLLADQSGFKNLFLAGDWTYTGVNAGCIEAAVMSGLRAARGVTGHKFPIIGEEEDFGKNRVGLAAPILKTTRAQNAPWPWSVAYGMADTTGPSALVPMSLDLVRNILPEGLLPVPQTVTPADTHPVIFLFARQRNVRPNLIPIGARYLEFTIAVPWVRPESEPLLPPVIYPLGLYLDNRAMIALGRYGYGFNKHRAWMHMNGNSYSIRNPNTGADILSCHYHIVGDPVPAWDMEGFKRIRPGYEQSLVNRNRLGYWQYANYDFSLGQALVQPTALEFTLHNEVFGVPPGTFTLPPMTQSAFGGFFLTSAATINNPLQTFQIKNTLRRIGA